MSRRPLRAVIAAIREYHYDNDGYCNACDYQYPCVTIEIIEGVR